MDVKFPVDNYLRHLEATTDAERDATRSAFLRDVRNRIKELASRGYADPRTTPGFLLLFIPNESVYAFIQEHDRAGVRHRAWPKVSCCARRSRSSPCSVWCARPSTASCSSGRPTRSSTRWRASRSSGQRFSDHVDKLGKQLATVQGTYDELATTRRRQLEQRLDEIDAIRTRRGLPGLDDDDDDRPETPVLREVGAL